jgi:alkaline phosphatase
MLRNAFFIIFFALISFFPLHADAQSAVKNVILMIGDGMGPQEVSLATGYRKVARPDAPPLALEKLSREGAYGSVSTYSHGHVVTDSAAAATAMACGFKTRDGMIGMGPNGETCESVAVVAAKFGKATGLVSNTRISHATPAPFAARNVSREDENAIALQIIEEARVDVFLNGGARHLLPGGKKFSSVPGCEGIDPMADGMSKRGDDKDLITTAKGKGYDFSCTKAQLAASVLAGKRKLLGVFTASVFPHIQEREGSATIPSLAEMTGAALTVLSRNEKGFFLMVEGGLIDYAGHENDAGTALQEVLDFDHAIGVALSYVKAHPETALIVTADHETGGFGIAYRQYVTGDDVEVERIAGGMTYQAAYLSAPVEKVFPVLAAQKSSFTALLAPFLQRIYVNNESPDGMTEEFRGKITLATGYDLDVAEAREVLKKESLIAVHPHDPHAFGTEASPEELHSGKLAKTLSYRNFCVWATGTHTSVEVPVWAVGPEGFTRRFAGGIDNTDIAKIVKKTLGQ